MLNIVLVEPQIPQNTGNVARTCAVTGARLHLVGPLGFTITDAKLKRAGLDYWDKLDITHYENTADFLSRNTGEFFFFEPRTEKFFTEVKYPPDAYLFFGKETGSLGDELLSAGGTCVKIPMRSGLRCLNLSNAVAVAVYEAWRQNRYN